MQERPEVCSLVGSVCVETKGFENNGVVGVLGGGDENGVVPGDCADDLRDFELVDFDPD